MKASVIIAARNAERTIKRAVLSATAQSLKNIEVIVIDDGSSDQTAAQVAELARVDPRIRLIRNPVSQGVSAARSTAIGLAKGDWLAILDADDWFSQDRLSVLLRSAEERALDVVIDNLNRVDALTGQPLGTAFPEGWMTSPEPISMSFLVERDIPYCQDIGFGYCKPVFSRSDFISKVGQYKKSLRCSEDVLALQTMLFGGSRVGTVNLATYFYSVDPHSFSNRPGTNIDIARVNRLIQRAARQVSPGMLPLLKSRQIIIEYDALRKALRQRRPFEAIYFLWHVQKRVIVSQLLRAALSKLGLSCNIIDPRSRAWLLQRQSGAMKTDA